MLELGIGAEIVRGVGAIIWLLFLSALGYALWSGKGLAGKALRSLIVVIVFVGSSLPNLFKGLEQRKRYAEAKMLFDEQCKAAGEKTYRTVEDVDGVFLLNVRSRTTSASVLDDPEWPDAALPNEPGQSGYIMTFLLWEQYQDRRNDRGFLNNKPSDRPGFHFVDVREVDGSVFRYRLALPDATEMTRTRVTGQPSRYAVSFVNMVDPAHRRLWVAGTKVTITDTSTHEVLAEKTWYALEPGQGSTAGGRSPWAFAQICPQHRGWNGGMTRFFVDQVLKPKKEE